MPEDRTLTVQVEAQNGGTTTRYYNADNIAYFTSKETDPTELAMAISLGVPIGLAVLLLLVAAWWQALLVGIVAFVLLILWMMEGEGVTIGTLTETHDFDVDEAEELEDEFKRATQNLLTVSDTHETAYNEFTYTHHFVPDNIVSIQRSRGETIDEFPLVFYLLGLFLGILAASQNVIVGGLLLLGLWAVGWIVDPIKQPDTVTLDLQNGDSHEFRLTSSDARNLVNQFQSSRSVGTSSPSSVQTESEPIETDDVFDRYPDKWHIPDGESEYAVDHPKRDGYNYYKTERGARDALKRWYD